MIERKFKFHENKEFTGPKTMYFDGALSKGGVGIGFNSRDESVAFASGLFFPKQSLTSSNVAEYMALIRLLQWIRVNPQKETIAIYGDSQMVVEQMNGYYSINEVSHTGKTNIYYPYALFAKDLLTGMNVKIGWIPRHKNEIADSYSRAGVDALKDNITDAQNRGNTLITEYVNTAVSNCVDVNSLLTNSYVQNL